MIVEPVFAPLHLEEILAVRIEFRLARLALLARRAFSRLASSADPDDSRGVADSKSAPPPAVLKRQTTRRRLRDHANSGCRIAPCSDPVAIATEDSHGSWVL